MSAIYRSYEVLVEETAEGHKTRKGGKTKKQVKPHHEKTRRALKITHDLFQDAVCYYILCLVGMVRDAKDAKGEPINRMWEFLHSEAMRDKTAAVVARLGSRYSHAPFHSSCDIQDFLSKTYGWRLPKSKKPCADSLLTTYRLLFQQASKASDQENQSVDLENLKTFAGNWIAILCNEDGDTTIPGQGVFDRLHRQLSGLSTSEPDSVWEVVEGYAQGAAVEKAATDADWKHRESIKISLANAKRKNAKSSAELTSLWSEAFEQKLRRDREAVKALFSISFSPSKAKKYCSLNGDVIRSVLRDVEAASVDDKRFVRLRYGARDNSMEPPLFRFLWLRDNLSYREAVARDLMDYVSKEKPEVELRDDGNKPVTKMPYQETGKEPLFPYFTNCLGLKYSGRAAWFEFDKSAFKRAAEEVFKYRIRSDERAEQTARRRAKIIALNATGGWRNEKGKSKQLGGIEGDHQRPALMRELLDELGGVIGYDMRRATIGGWADLRQSFLRIASKSESIDEEDLERAVSRAREDSAGAFGSGPLFKALCKEKYHPLWLPRWENRQPHHPKNFVRWWVLYCEAKAELDKVWNGDEKAGQPKPISFTWPGTKNRFGETSFRPLDFECEVATTPSIDLFYDEADGRSIKLIKTNATPPRRSSVKKSDATTEDPLTDETGNPFFPFTLSYRRFKRDTITDANGSSADARFAPPLVAGEPPAFQKVLNKKPLEVGASLLPSDKHGCVHLMFSFKLEQAMRQELAKETVPVPGKGSVRIIKTSGKWLGLNLRWPIDAKTEKKKSEEPATDCSEEIEQTEVKFSPNKLWCAETFEPFDLLSVDLGVRYSGAWCRARVKVGRDADRPNQRTISPAGHPHEIVFDAYDFGTFRLQGEDAKIWRKDKNTGFGDEPEVEKCGSRGRIASDTERKEFLELAEKLLPATPRLPLPREPEETKFFPDLADHLVFRLRRRLRRIRFLFRLRWQAIGKKSKFGNDYRKPENDDEKVAMQQKKRFSAVASLAYVPNDERPDEEEDGFLRDLRLTVAKQEVWSALTYKHNGKEYGLFATVRGGNKEERETRKAAQKEAQAKLKMELAWDSGKWNWQAVADKAEDGMREAMSAFAGEEGSIAEVARFVWPLQDKKWKWTQCAVNRQGEVEQSHLERDDESREPKRFIHGMRGLNMKRIRLMQDFRQCCQSLAKLERRYYTDADKGLEPSPVRRGECIHEPAQAFLDKINELREQRVYQTAHMILAEALGLELKNPAEVLIDGKSKWELKSERDLHGRYQPKRKNGKRVAGIVLEDLSRYRTSQDRSRYENSQLMEWSHRAIIAKLQDMAQIFGIQIITVDARFSSRFCSRTGVPGIRCAQVAKGFEKEYPWKKWAEEEDNKEKTSERARLINTAAKMLNISNDPTATLVLPMDGGPAFLPVLPHVPNKEGLEANADIGAAVNIGLRCVGHPDRLDIFPVLRTETKGNEKLEIKNRRGSLCEVLAKPDKRIVSPVKSPAKPEQIAETGKAPVNEDSGDEELESGTFPYLYAAVQVGNRDCLLIDDENRYQLPRGMDGRELQSNDAMSVSAAQGKIFWSRVKQDCWKRLKQINATRLQKLGIGPPNEWLI